MLTTQWDNFDWALGYIKYYDENKVKTNDSKEI